MEGGEEARVSKWTHLPKQANGDTSTEELAHVLGGELAKDIEGMFFDGGGLLVGILGVVRNDGGGKVGVVDRVVDGDRDFKAGVVVDHCAGYARPHRLRIGIADGIRISRGGDDIDIERLDRAHREAGVGEDIGSLGGDDTGEPATNDIGGLGLELVGRGHGWMV